MADENKNCTAGQGNRLDDDPVVRALMKANPWARGLDLAEENAEFCAKRREACVSRFGERLVAWNAWAETMLELKSALEERRLWAVQDPGPRFRERSENPETHRAENELTRLWLLLGHVDFAGVKFGPSSFARFQFPGTADFGRVEFSAEVNFAGAIFSRDVFFFDAIFNGDADLTVTRFARAAVFDGAEFKDMAYFTRAEFNQEAQFGTKFERAGIFRACFFKGEADFRCASFETGADFSQATFCGNAMFVRARVGTDASFAGATFESFVDFTRVIFQSRADFSAVQSKSAFSLAATTFEYLPDFSQSDFKQAPQFDAASFRMPKLPPPWSLMRRTMGGGTVSGVPNLSHQYRALKRLAIQSHDHMRELEFHAGEIRTRRGIWDKPLGPNAGAYWFGLLYEATSNFGRSLVRPIAWLCASLPVFAGLYWALRIEGETRCSTITAAAYLSFKKGIALTNLEAGEKLKQAYACLYGTASPSPGQGTVVPVIPNLVEALTVLQTILSAVLLFLFALALRNHFRIR